MFAKKTSPALTCFLDDLRPADSGQGRSIAHGTFAFARYTQNTGNFLPFDLSRPPVAWQRELHGFSWLRHFSQGVCEGDGDLANLARYYVEAWAGEQNRSKVAWNLQTTAQRVISWLTNGALLTSNREDIKWQNKIRKILVEHGKFLLRKATSKKMNPEGRMSAGVALVLLGLSLDGYDHWVELGFTILMKEAGAQILPDGGHISRNPSEHLGVLFDFLTLRKNLLKLGRPGPDKLPAVIDRMLPMLRFFIHGDGKLALFNGAGEEDKSLLQAALANDDTGGKPFAFAPHSAYQRLNAGRTLLLVDIGRPPPAPFASTAHAGCLSLEMSSGKQRFIVNCGNGVGLDEEWKNAARATAAHSTLTLQNTSSARKSPLGKILGRRLSGIGQVDSNRNETSEGVWLDAGHDGYAKNFGLTHRRKLFLEKNGQGLHGEDCLHGSPANLSKNADKDLQKKFAVRFHFHPQVSCALTNRGQGLVAKLPNGEGWQFKAQTQTAEGSPVESCPLKIEESIYLGGGKPRRAQQLVIHSQTGRQSDQQAVAKVRWLWQRIDKAS